MSREGKNLAEADGIHAPRNGKAGLRLGPFAHLQAGERRCVGHERRCGIEAHAPFPHRHKCRAMGREQAKRVMGDRGARPEEDHGEGLMGNLVIAGLECRIGASRSHEAQAAILDLEATAIEPQKAVAIVMGHAGLVEAEATEEHGAILPGQATTFQSQTPDGGQGHGQAAR